MCRSRPWVVAAGLCGLVSGTPGVSAQTLTEADALARMRREYAQPTALAAGVRQLAAEERERRLVTNPTLSYTRESAGRSVDDFVLVTQELPVRGRRRLLAEAGGRAVAAAEAAAEAHQLDAEAGLRLAFTDLLVAQARVRTLEAGIDELTRLVEILRVRETGGEGARFDRVRAEREVAEIEADLGVAAAARLAAQARLAAFFAPGDDPTTLTAAGELTAVATPAPVETLVTDALARRPDYHAASLDASRWTVERQAAERLRLPAAAVTAGMKRSGTEAARDGGYAVTATMALPIFDRGQGQVARAEAAWRRATAERELLGARITRDVRVAHAALAEYREVARRYRVGSVDRATELTAIARAAYEEGEYGILELLDAHRVALGAELRWHELGGDARRAHVELERAAGRRATP